MWNKKSLFDAKDYSLMPKNCSQLIRGGLGHAPVKCNSKGEPLPVVMDESGKNFHIVLYPDVKQEQFENALHEFKQEHRFPLRRFRLDNFLLSSVILLFTLLVVLFIGFLAVYQDLFSAAIIELNIGSRYAQVLLLVTGVLAVVVITYLPSFFTAESSWIKDRLLRWKNHKFRVRKKFQRELNFLLPKKNQELKVVVWNVSQQDIQQWHWDYLFPVLAAIPCEKTFYLTTYREQENIEKLSDILTVEESTISYADSPTNNNSVSLTNIALLLGRKDRYLLKFLQPIAGLVCPDTLNHLRLRNIPLTRVVPFELCVALVKGCRDVGIDSEPGTEEQVVANFYMRLIRDYGVLGRQFAHQRIYYHFLQDECVASAAQLDASDLALADYIPHLQLFIKQARGPISLIAAINLLSRLEDTPADLMSRYQTLITLVRDQELYSLADLIFYFLLGDDSERTLRSSDLLGLSLQALNDLLEICEHSAKYDNALSLARHLSKINPVNYRMIEARLLERQGDYQGAYTVLCELQEDYFQVDTGTNVDNSMLALSFYLHQSWTVVSGRLLEYRTCGETALDHAMAIIVNSNGRNIEPYLLWRYYNNRANYAEWLGDLAGAAEHHEAALGIPGIDQKWISATYTNLGITYRLLMEQADAPECQEFFDKSYLYLDKGLQVKRQLGDDDELPITLHNYALLLLKGYRINEFVACTAEHVKKAAMLALEGLQILKRTDSLRKKGELLTELVIAARLLTQQGQPLAIGDENWPEQLQQWLQEQPANQVADLRALLEVFQLP